jgi:hypothetical protein
MASMKLSGGKKLEEALKLLAAKAKNSAVLSVGFPEGATYPDGTPVPFVAAMNEFGHEVKSKDGDYYQMPRPFFRGMISQESPHWGRDLGKLLKSEDYDAEKSLNLMGEEIEGELVESIQKLTSPPLADSTVAAKGSDKPLIDTGLMWQSVKSFVEET